MSLDLPQVGSPRSTNNGRFDEICLCDLRMSWARLKIRSMDLSFVLSSAFALSVFRPPCTSEEMSDQIIRSFLMEEVSRLFLIILMILKNSLMRTRIRISASTAIRMLRTGCAMTQEKTPLWGTVTAAVSSSVLICLHSALCIPALFCLLCRLFLFLQDCACAAAAVRLRSRRCLLRRVKEP